jgi:hypothetical protein
MLGVSICTPGGAIGWTDEIVEGDAALTLSSSGVEITLDAIYEDTELDATRLRKGGHEVPAL